MQSSGREGVISITSRNATKVGGGPSFSADAQFAEAKFQVSWQGLLSAASSLPQRHLECRWTFSRGIGAVLAIDDPVEVRASHLC